MKKIIFILISVLNFSIYAQPVLNASDINPIDISGNSYSGFSSTETTGASGANVTWDFSKLELVDSEPFSAKSVLKAPFSSSFPSSNFFITFENGSDYDYYNLTNSKMEYLGDSSKTSVGVIYTNPETILIFPFTYNTVFNDTYQIPPFPIFNKSITYDAYGTLILPFETYSNVIRIKEIIDENVEYIWIKTNPYYEIMRASIDEFNGSLFFSVVELTNLSINENNTKTQFSIVPNPATNNFTIKNEDFDGKEIFLNVYNILGNQIIKDYKIDSNSENINISNFANGLYITTITDNKNTVLYSSKIIKN